MARWGNSLAVRIPSAVVEALECVDLHAALGVGRHGNVLPDDLFVRRHLLDLGAADVDQEIAIGKQGNIVRSAAQRHFPFDLALGIDDRDMAPVGREHLPVGMDGGDGEFVGERGEGEGANEK